MLTAYINFSLKSNNKRDKLFAVERALFYSSVKCTGAPKYPYNTMAIMNS